jgi:hypothetical protein
MPSIPPPSPKAQSTGGVGRETWRKPGSVIPRLPIRPATKPSCHAGHMGIALLPATRCNAGGGGIKAVRPHISREAMV